MMRYSSIVSTVSIHLFCVTLNSIKKPVQGGTKTAHTNTHNETSSVGQQVRLQFAVQDANFVLGLRDGF